MANKKLQKSPVYWEKLLAMPDGAMRAAFEDAARLSLSWAVDQARCLSHHVAPASEKASIIREFCEVAAPVALRSGDLDTAVQAYHLAANDPALKDEPAKQAAQNIRAVLDDMARQNRQRALGTAILLKARTVRNPEILAQVVDFLIAQADDDGYRILMNVVRTVPESLSANSMGLLLERTIRLARIRPYQAFDIAREIINQDCKLTAPQERLVLTLKDRLENDPTVLLAILENEYGSEATESLRLSNINPALVIPEKPILN